MNRSRSVLGIMSLVLSMVVPAAAASAATTAPAAEAVKCGGLAVTIMGTSGSDTIVGTAGRDVIAGLGGDDIINGRGGNDVICGNLGADTLIGAAGRDRLIGGAGADELIGGKAIDRLVGGGGNDTLEGDAGADMLNGGAGADALFGGGGNDELLGAGGNDRLRGQAGVDFLDGGAARDNCIGEREINCEIVRRGPRIDVFQGDESQTFTSGRTFHIWHGWICDPAAGDCSEDLEATVDFRLLIDGAEATEDGVELRIDNGLWVTKRWVYNFRGGMTGVHTFTAEWSENGVVLFERTITVTFV